MKLRVCACAARKQYLSWHRDWLTAKYSTFHCFNICLAHNIPVLLIPDSISFVSDHRIVPVAGIEPLPVVGAGGIQFPWLASGHLYSDFGCYWYYYFK